MPDAALQRATLSALMAAPGPSRSTPAHAERGDVRLERRVER
jgi:hypothetical protein